MPTNIPSQKGLSGFIQRNIVLVLALPVVGVAFVACYKELLNRGLVGKQTAEQKNEKE